MEPINEIVLLIMVIVAFTSALLGFIIGLSLKYNKLKIKILKWIIINAEK